MKDIIEGLNQFYEQFPDRVKGQYILQNRVDSNTVVKSQKTYIAQVWFVTKGKKFLMFEGKITQRVVTESEENKVLSLLTTSITKSLLEHISSVEFKELSNGTYSNE